MFKRYRDMYSIHVIFSTQFRLHYFYFALNSFIHLSNNINPSKGGVGDIVYRKRSGFDKNQQSNLLGSLL